MTMTIMMMRKTMNKNFPLSVLVIFFGLGLASCQSTKPEPVYSELTFGHLGPINLNVESIEIVSTFKMTMRAPNVEHLFPTSPESALKRWAADRLIAVGSGSSGAQARFTIVDASVREVALQTTDGIEGAFTKDQSERYEAVVEVKLEVTQDKTGSRQFTTAKVSRSITVREDATLNEREQVWFNLNEALMEDINAKLEKNISQYLGDWLKK